MPLGEVTENPGVPASQLTVDDLVLLGKTNPSNPRHFDTIEGRRTCVSDTLCAKIRVPDTKNTVSDTFCIKNSV